MEHRVNRLRVVEQLCIGVDFGAFHRLRDRDRAIRQRTIALGNVHRAQNDGRDDTDCGKRGHERRGDHRDGGCRGADAEESCNGADCTSEETGDGGHAARHRRGDTGEELTDCREKCQRACQGGRRRIGAHRERHLHEIQHLRQHTALDGGTCRATGVLDCLRAALRRIDGGRLTVLGAVAGLQALGTGVLGCIGLVRAGLALGTLIAFGFGLAVLVLGLLDTLGRDLRRRGLRRIVQHRRFIDVYAGYTRIFHFTSVRHVSHLLVVKGRPLPCSEDGVSLLFLA